MEHLFPIQYSYLIPLMPLLGAVITGLFGARGLKGRSHWPIWIGSGISAILSIWLLWQMVAIGAEPQYVGKTISYVQHWYTWIAAGDFISDGGFLFDPLSAVMLSFVTGIGFLIIIFSKGYMAGERGYFRFFAYLGLFIFSMTVLVMGNNLILLFLGWEGVGLCSYLLIGYYYEKPSAREAGKKAFIVNRIGDFGFLLGIMLIFSAFGTISFIGGAGESTGPGFLEMVAAGNLTQFQQFAVQLAPFLLMLGAFGKSAQFPLYVWLPDAMEGPTPVSALMHAATMVTAGAYVIIRCSAIFFANNAALITIAVIGALTAILAATIALREFDLKKVFAYSTVSQLGYMFVAVACLAPVAGIFHMVTHAFFKALLFLTAGIVMHAMLGELDMRKMSGLKRILPKTRILMLVGCLALAGFPLFSGFFSKDEVVNASWQRNVILGIAMLFTSFLTAYYTFRLYFRVFEGPLVLPEPVQNQAHDAGSDAHGHDAHDGDTHGGHASGGHGHGGHEHNHEPMIMIVPVFILAIGAVLAGYLNWPKHSMGDFLGQSPSFSTAYTVAVANAAHEVEPAMLGAHVPGAEHPPLVPMIMILSAIIAVIGIVLAWYFHLKNRPADEKLAAAGGFYTRLLERKYWVDEIYQAGIVESCRKLGKFFFAIDKFVIDGIIWLISFIPQLSGFVLKLTTQRGYLQGYAATMLFGIAVILLIVLGVF